MLVLDLYTDGITRSVRFVIESDRTPERAVGLQRKEGIVSVSDSTHQVISQYRSGIRIGRIEFTNYGPRRLVLVKRKRAGRTQSTGWVVRRALVHAQQKDRKVAFRRGVMLVLDLYTDGITRSVRFVIESDRLSVPLVSNVKRNCFRLRLHSPSDKSEPLRHPDRSH